MWKLVAFLIGMVVMLIFAGFNYSNISNISLGFYVFKDVPIFISLLVAFVGGIFFALPFALRGGRSAKKKRVKESAKSFTCEGLDRDKKGKKKKEQTSPKKREDEAPLPEEPLKKPLSEHPPDPKSAE